MKNLFKGKRIDNVWEYGYLLYSFEGVHIVNHNYDFKPSNGEDPILTDVIPGTVCQFTGLFDKNKIKVFEGDKFIFNNEVRYIQYIYDRCRYVLTNGDGFDSRNTIDLDCDVVHDSEIIGNIYD